MGIESLATGMELGGYLLLAAPTMLDQNFRRTAVLLHAHRHDAGAHGLILDRPLPHRVGELVDSPHPQIARLPVHLGGPCATHLLMFAVFDWELDGRARIALCGNQEQALEALAKGYRVRAFAGHSGWAGGQLEGELEREDWLVTMPHPELFDQDFTTAAAWTGHLRAMGPLATLLSHIPQDPLAN